MKVNRLFIFFIFCLLSLQGQATDWDRVLSQRGMVDPCTLDSTIRIHLMYATPDNFLGKILYTSITRAWLRPEAAKKLVQAPKLLKKEYPGRAILI